MAAEDDLKEHLDAIVSDILAADQCYFLMVEIGQNADAVNKKNFGEMFAFQQNDAVSTVVKLPIGTSSLGSVFGHADPNARSTVFPRGTSVAEIIPIRPIFTEIILDRHPRAERAPSARVSPYAYFGTKERKRRELSTRMA
jgi:hypothetical protein